MSHSLPSRIGRLFVYVTIIIIVLAVVLAISGNESVGFVLLIALIFPLDAFGIPLDVALILTPILGLIILYVIGYGIGWVVETIRTTAGYQSTDIPPKI
jgi:hypothetical protein